MKFSVAVTLFFALVAIARAGQFKRALDEEVDLPDPVTLQLVLEFSPSMLVTGVDGTDPVIVPGIIDDVDVLVTRERTVGQDDAMVPVRRPVAQFGVPVTMNGILSDEPPTPPTYTTPPIYTPPVTDGPTTPEEPTEPPVPTPYDRSNNRAYMMAA